MGALTDAIRSMGGWLGPYSSGDKALAALFGGPPTASGVTVNEYTALNLSAVWDAVQIISGAVATLPLKLYKRLPNDGKEPFTEHPAYRLLAMRPNPTTSSIVFRMTLQSHVLLWGNAYAEIQRDASGRAVALWPITPDRVEPHLDNQTLRYRVTNPNGQVDLDAERILHIQGLGFDGVKGYSVIYKARESLGLVAATEKFGAQFFANGAVSSLVASHPMKLSTAAYQNLRESLERQMTGDKKHSMLLLEEGIKVERTSIPPDDAQFLDTRKFQVIEVARWFNVPPHKLKDLERATFSNIEHQAQEFVDDTLMPWLETWEQELNEKIVRPLERTQQYFKHNVNARLRGDTTARAAWNTAMRQWGMYSANDVLRREDENPIGPQGDIYLVPGNMWPADRLQEIIDKQVAPDPAPVAPPEEEPTEPPARWLEVIEALRAEVVRQPPELATFTAEPDPRPDVILEAIKALPQPPDLAPVLAAQEDLRVELAAAQAVRQAQAARMAGLVPSLRTVIEAALRTEMRFEASRARKAAVAPDKLQAWIEAFYATRGEACVARLLPVVGLPFIVTGRGDEAEAETRRLVTGWVAEARAHLTALLDHGETLEADVDALVTRWEMDRPATVADELIAGVIAHV